MTYKLHKQFNWKSASARLRKPMAQQERVERLMNRLQAAKALRSSEDAYGIKSNVGPKVKLVHDSEGKLLSWHNDSGWKDTM